jgi:long-subunit fatty acid transport protein
MANPRQGKTPSGWRDSLTKRRAVRRLRRFDSCKGARCFAFQPFDAVWGEGFIAVKRAAIAISISLWSSLALAGGFEYPDVGTVAMGRGSAFAAKADDGTAIYYNPAGLADQDGWRVTLDVTMGAQNSSFQRQDATGADVGPQVSNAPGVFFAPFVAVTRGFNLGFLGKLGVAVGLYSPPANGGVSYPNETPPVLGASGTLQFDGNSCEGTPPAAAACPGANTSSLNTAPQKYMLINENLLVVYPTISAAWAPIPLVSIGAGLQLLVANSAFREATYDAASLETSHTPSNEQLTYDTIANVAVNGVTVAANFGIKLKPLPGLSIGASYKPKATLNQSGTLTLDFSPLAQSLNAKVSGNGTSNSSDGSSGSGPVSLSNAFPGELKTGIDYDFGLFDLEADFDWTQWSQYQSAVLTPNFSQQSNATPVTALSPIVITRNFQDTWSLRLGGEAKLPVPVIRARVRAGLGYESSMYNPNATQYVTVDYANFEQYWGAIGATVGVGAFDIDLTYSHVYIGTVGFNVGNGVFNTAYDLLALGVRAHF